MLRVTIKQGPAFLLRAIGFSAGFSATLVFRLALGFTSIGGLITMPAVAADAKWSDPANETLVELFTSHGCSSCPPADLLLGELLNEHPNLVALEFHVDYWDQLVHGADGNWVDPFSSPEYTLRQRYYYAVSLQGRPGVYTPQMVVNGQYAAVGSDATRIKRQISRDSAPALVEIRYREAGDQSTIVDIRNQSRQKGDVWLATYQKQAETAITAGENRHRKMINHHIVTSFEHLGSLKAEGNQIELDLPANGEQGCAILVQSAALEQLYAAARCPG